MSGLRRKTRIYSAEQGIRLTSPSSRDSSQEDVILQNSYRAAGEQHFYMRGISVPTEIFVS